MNELQIFNSEEFGDIRTVNLKIDEYTAQLMEEGLI